MASGNSSYHKVLSKWAKVWRTPDLPRRVSISFSKRMRNSLGRARPKSGMITVNAKCASASRAFLLEVICHEAAHVAAYMLYGLRTKPHGPEWAQLLRAAGYQPSTSLKACEWKELAPSRVLAHRHHYFCPICQADLYVTRKNSRLHCNTCFSAGVTTPLQFCPPK